MGGCEVIPSVVLFDYCLVKFAVVEWVWCLENLRLMGLARPGWPFESCWPGANLDQFKRLIHCTYSNRTRRTVSSVSFEKHSLSCFKKRSLTKINCKNNNLSFEAFIKHIIPMTCWVLLYSPLLYINNPPSIAEEDDVDPADEEFFQEQAGYDEF